MKFIQCQRTFDIKVNSQINNWWRWRRWWRWWWWYCFFGFIVGPILVVDGFNNVKTFSPLHQQIVFLFTQTTPLIHPLPLVNISCTKIISRDGESGGRQEGRCENVCTNKLYPSILFYILDVQEWKVIFQRSMSLLLLTFLFFTPPSQSSSPSVRMLKLSMCLQVSYSRKRRTIFFVSHHKIHFISYQKQNFKLFFLSS